MGIARKELKSGNEFKYQRIFVVLKTTSNITRHSKSSAAPLYHSLVTFLNAMSCKSSIEHVYLLVGGLGVRLGRRLGGFSGGGCVPEDPQVEGGNPSELCLAAVFRTSCSSLVPSWRRSIQRKAHYQLENCSLVPRLSLSLTLPAWIFCMKHWRRGRAWYGTAPTRSLSQFNSWEGEPKLPHRLTV